MWSLKNWVTNMSPFFPSHQLNVAWDGHHFCYVTSKTWSPADNTNPYGRACLCVCVCVCVRQLTHHTRSSWTTKSHIRTNYGLSSVILYPGWTCPRLRTLVLGREHSSMLCSWRFLFPWVTFSFSNLSAPSPGPHLHCLLLQSVLLPHFYVSLTFWETTFLILSHVLPLLEEMTESACLPLPYQFLSDI